MSSPLHIHYQCPFERKSQRDCPAGADPLLADPMGSNALDKCNQGGIALLVTNQFSRDKKAEHRRCEAALKAACERRAVLRRQKKSAAGCGHCGAQEGLKRCGG